MPLGQKVQTARIGVRIKMTPREATKKILDQLERRMTEVALLVEATAVELISTGQPVVRTKSGRLRGLNPSAPGEPPHVLYGRLKQSINHVIIRQSSGVGRGVRALVGTDVIYARRLELGFVGTDALGRNYNQLERPFLRPAVKNNEATILRILTRG